MHVDDAVLGNPLSFVDEHCVEQLLEGVGGFEMAEVSVRVLLEADVWMR